MLRHSKDKVHGEGKKKKGDRYSAHVKKTDTRFKQIMDRIGNHKFKVEY